MNIWYVSKYATPAKYFFGTRHFNLAEQWVKGGNNVVVITSNSSHLTDNLPKFKAATFREEINGVDTIWLNTVKSKKSSGASRILSWIHFDLNLLFFNKKGIIKPDTIIASSLSLTTVIPAWLLSRRYKCKFVFEVRDIWPLSIIILGGYSKSNPFIWVLSWIEKFGYNNANLIVGTMPNLSAHVDSVTNQSARCICIPQGLNVDFYKDDQRELSVEYINKWIPKNKFLVCYAGSINVNNPLNGLVEAAKLLCDKDIHFLILGNGDLKNEMIDLCKDLANVTFPPSIHKNQVNDFLKRVDVCYDSFESELAKYGLSRNKWIDYMYAEKPIICSFDGFQTMINEAFCGSFVTFNDSFMLSKVILEYSEFNRSRLLEIGGNGKRFLLKHRKFEKLASEYLEEIKNSRGIILK